MFCENRGVAFRNLLQRFGRLSERCRDHGINCGVPLQFFCFVDEIGWVDRSVCEPWYENRIGLRLPFLQTIRPAFEYRWTKLPLARQCFLFPSVTEFTRVVRCQQVVADAPP